MERLRADSSLQSLPYLTPLFAACCVLVACVRVDLDVLVGNYNQANQLLLNDGVGGLTEVTSSALAIGSASTLAIFVADMDGDGGASARAIRARGAVWCMRHVHHAWPSVSE